jgi:hypothetical protein
MVRHYFLILMQAASSVVFALCSPDLESVADFTYINNCFPTKVKRFLVKVLLSLISFLKIPFLTSSFFQLNPKQIVSQKFLCPGFFYL